jgi:hypothetical protein
LIPNVVKEVSTSNCPACAVGKGKRTPCHPRDACKARPQPGQILHADVCFPKGLSPDCLLTVVDEGSRFAFAFPLKAKSAAANSLQTLILQLERKDFKPHTLRTDNGGEFTSAEFRSWLASRGIEHCFTPADTPQANGLIERYHGTLMPRLRAVLNARQIPRAVWSEVLQGVVYVLNRSPHQGINGMIPYEAFYKRDLSSLAHLRVLGSVCYYKLPGHKSKLDPRMRPAILVGYNSDGRGPTAAYKLYDPSTRRFINSTDVIFDERPADENMLKTACRTISTTPPGVVIPFPATPQTTHAVHANTAPVLPNAVPMIVPVAPSSTAAPLANTAPVVAPPVSTTPDAEDEVSFIVMFQLTNIRLARHQDDLRVAIKVSQLQLSHLV